MSALGQKRTLRGVRPMSALPPKSGFCGRGERADGEVLICLRRTTLLRRANIECAIGTAASPLRNFKRVNRAH